MALLNDALNTLNSTQQYGRVCSLIVFGNDLDGLDLSELRIKFSIKKSGTLTPNTAEIRVYNVEEETAKQIKKEFSQVILQAGYKGNFGTIFQGNIKQVIIGRESSTDTFIDIIAGDGDRAYNFAIVNETLAAGSTQIEQVNTAIASMEEMGVSKGYVNLLSTQTLPRGKVMFGNSINYLRNVAQTTGQEVSIQDEKVQYVKLTSYLPGERVVLTSKTGLVGTPQQTNEGINVKCLLNPLIKVGGNIEIENESIQALKIDLNSPNGAANIPAPLTQDGVYNVYVVEYIGDTRGVEWYCNLITLNVDVTTNPLNSVSSAGGGLL